MQIFIKPSFSPNQTKREVAKPEALKELQRNINMEKHNLEGKRIQDPVQSMRNLKMWQNTLDKVKPHTLTPEEKNFLWIRAKRLKDEFTQGMLSQDELHPVRSIHGEKGIQVVVDETKMGNSHSVERQVGWDKRNSAKVAEFKNIMRQLNPGNPYAGDIERYRPKAVVR